MSDLNLDLNIYNYSKYELKEILHIGNEYNVVILKKKLSILKKNIFSLQLSKQENTEFTLFFNMMECVLMKDLETKRLEEYQKQLKCHINGDEKENIKEFNEIKYKIN